MKNKKIMIILIALMMIVCLTEKTYAKTFTTTKQYRVYKCDSHNDYEGCDFTSWTNNGTTTSNTPSSTVVRGFSMNFAQNETLSQGGLFRVVIDFQTNRQDGGVQILHSYTCWGVNSNSTSGGLEENIQSCELVSTIPKTDGVRYIFNVTPAVNIKSIKINIYLNSGIGFTSVKGLASSSLSNDTSTSDAINEQTDILIDNQNQNTEEIINSQNACYNSEVKDNGNLGYLEQDGSFVKSNNTATLNRTSNYIVINSSTSISVVNTNSTITYWFIFYDKNMNKISGFLASTKNNGDKITIPANSKYFRYSYKLNEAPIYLICTNGNQIISDTLNQDHTYNNNASQSTTNQENQMNSFEQEEDALRNSLNLNIEDAEITINPNASSFIWDVVNRLRTMSGKIVLLFTSVLSLGIMKMILGR